MIRRAVLREIKYVHTLRLSNSPGHTQMNVCSHEKTSYIGNKGIRTNRFSEWLFVKAKSSGSKYSSLWDGIKKE